MDIVVCVKTNLDLQMVRIKNREPVLEAIPYKVGDLDKNALEAAIQIARRGADVTVVALTVAEANRKIKETMKEALAIGADEAVIVDDPALAATDQAAVAAVHRQGRREARRGDLLLFGEGSTDNYTRPGGVARRRAARPAADRLRAQGRGGRRRRALRAQHGRHGRDARGAAAGRGHRGERDQRAAHPRRS